MEEEEAAVPDEKRCANPACPDPTSDSRLQCLPAGFTGECVPGERSTFIARKRCVLGGVLGCSKESGAKAACYR